MDRFGAAFLFAFGLFMAYQASRLPMRDMSEGPGPGFLPLVLSLAMTALAATSFLRPEINRIQTPNLGRILLLLATVVVYALALDRLGYVVTTFLVLAFLLIALVDREPLVSTPRHGRSLAAIPAARTSVPLIMLAACVTLGSYYVFRILLLVPLPPDPLDLWR